MEPTSLILLILVMATVTYGTRALPMLALSQRQAAPWMQAALAFVPPALMGALFAASLQTEGGIHWRFVLASVPALLVAYRTRSLVWTVVVGLGVDGLLQFILK